ncbi:hypothetical protein BGZ95_003427 [Linnemannia exigua]|uniref:F-box domain-containing protein n=1 Tax=Linnemannia exigua TaxID=604196 RepID=A0AAD4D6B7_9FUNG|nr:hypothetical protein BGZ95_003427 [Linnemannia exigua]
MAIATATTAATAPARVSVAGKGGGGAGGEGNEKANASGEPVRGRPYLDSKLVQHPLNHTTLATFITTTTTAAAAITSADTKTTTTKEMLTENQLEKNPLVGPAPVSAGEEGEQWSSRVVQHPLPQATFNFTSTATSITESTTTTPASKTLSRTFTTPISKTLSRTFTTPISKTLSRAATMTATAENATLTPGDGQLEKIPLDVLFDIALHLPSTRDFTNLLLASKYIFYSLDTHWVRYQRFLLRFGRKVLLSLLNPRDPSTLELLSGETEEIDDTTIASKEDLTMWYSKHSRNAVPPDEMGLAHRDNGYWRFDDDSRGPYGKIATLIAGLAWLNVSANMPGVMPGRYWVQWGFCLRNPSSVTGTQFRVSTFPRDEIPVWHHESPDIIDYTPRSFRQFLHHTNAINKDIVSPTETLIFQLPYVLVVEEDKPTVFLQMREHNTNKDGIVVLFLRLVPAGDDEDDVKTEREDVEGEEDAFVAFVERDGGENEYEGGLFREEYRNELVEYDEDEEEDDYELSGFDDEGNMLIVDDNNGYEDGEDDTDLGGASYSFGYNYFMNGGEVGDGGEIEDHHEINDYNGAGYNPAAYFHPFANGDEEEDDNARPYFIRMAERHQLLH